MNCILLTRSTAQVLENLCPPPRIVYRNKEASENVKFIGGVTLTRYLLSTYVDSNNA